MLSGSVVVLWVPNLCEGSPRSPRPRLCQGEGGEFTGKKGMEPPFLLYRTSHWLLKQAQVKLCDNMSDN